MSLIYTAPVATVGVGMRHSIYIGGRTDAKDLAKLERWGISRILNVTPAKEQSMSAGVPNFFETSGKFVYQRIPIYDASTSVVQLEESAGKIVDFIHKALFHGSVLVHCQRGVSRSSACVLLYLTRKANITLLEGLEMIQRRRPQAQPIPAFMSFLESYEKKCLKEREEAGDPPDGTTMTRPSKKARMMVGPQVPPSSASSYTTKGPNMGPLAEVNSQRIGPSIGPTMPPSMKKKAGVIGPSLPHSKDAKNKG